MSPSFRSSSSANALLVRSITRPLRTKRLCGPRSLTRTMMDFPLARFVTLILWLNLTPQIAQVYLRSSNISLFAVCLLIPGDCFEYQEACPTIYFRLGGGRWASSIFASAKVTVKTIVRSIVIVFKVSRIMLTKFKYHTILRRKRQ